MTERRIALQVDRLSLAFAGLKALSNVSFAIPQGSISGLIGPNGAGKTTLLNCLTRIYSPDSGTLRFGETELLKKSLHDITSLGIARTFQNLELFGAATALDNVLIGALSRTRIPLLADFLGLPSARRTLADASSRALAMMQRLEIADSAYQQVSTLAYGIQKRVELARALMTEPTLLLLDEPAAGLNAEETRALAATLQHLKTERGMTIVLVEHDMSLVMDICDELVVLDHGEVIARGSPDIVRNDPKVVTAYLGVEDDDDAA